MAALNNKILIGTNDETTASYVFENDNIFSVDGEMAIGVIGDELTIDTLTPIVRFIGDSDSLWSADMDSLQSYDEDDLYSAGELRLSISYGTPVWWYNNSVLSGKFYVESVERTGKEQYQLNCISVIGLLDTKTHTGAVYTGETFSTILSSILSSTLSSSDYEVDSDVASISVYGWLPYDSARENLHKLLMAYNVSMVKAEADTSKIRFCFLGSDTATEISNDRIYNDGSVDYGKMPTKVNVTEHTYINWPEGTEEIELYNNTDSGIAASNETVIFDEPVIVSTVRAEGKFYGTWTVNADESLDEYIGSTWTVGVTKTFYSYEIDSYGNITMGNAEDIVVNSTNRSQIIGKYIDISSAYSDYDWAKITSLTISGSTATYRERAVMAFPTASWSPSGHVYTNYAVITGNGKLYGKPYTHQTKEMTYTTGATGTENIASLSDNTLITAQNGRNVADRLIDYYGNADTQKVEIKMSGEKAGKKYSFQNAFNETQTGLLTRITLSISSFIKGICEIVTGLLYPGKGTLYNNVYECQASSWTVPSGVTKVRAVLIGGGNGGDSGYAGEDGEDATTSGGNGGEGGAGGNGGKGGRIYSVELNVTPGDTISCSQGSNGSGGSGTSATHDTNVAGAEGGATTITYNGTTYSSASGASSSSGYYEFINKNIYAKPSLVSGTKGGNGGKGGTAKDYSYDDTTVGEAGESVGSYSGGSGGTFGTFSITVPTGSTLSRAYSNLPQVQSGSSISWLAARYHGTGGGGGACATSAGNAGTGASGTSTNVTASGSTNTVYTFTALAHGMKGGNGATPTAPSSQNRNFGDGGAGGHGGSGGGGGGATNTQLSTASYTVSSLTTTVVVDTQLDSSYSNNCKGGSGGAGGNGESGYSGIVLFYYAT